MVGEGSGTLQSGNLIKLRRKRHNNGSYIGAAARPSPV